ncbi:MAG: hypothetical protein ACFCU5_20110 [Pleurocapsa sp.]
MNNKYSTNFSRERYLKLWIYLIPIVGIIPATWTLSTKKGDLEQQKASRISMILMLVWLGSYCSLSLGAVRASEIIAFRLMYANVLLTTGYFLTCTWLMWRLAKGNLVTLPQIYQYIKSDRK